MRRTRRRIVCRYCEKEILVGEYQVVCQHYMKLKTGKVWWFRRSFHPQCWIDQAIADLEKRPVVETRGRKKMVLADADKSARTAILRRRASVIQRIKRAVGENQNTDKIIHLGEMLNKLKEEIELVGGVPESWK